MAMHVTSFLLDGEVGLELLEHMHNLSVSPTTETVTVRSRDPPGTV